MSRETARKAMSTALDSVLESLKSLRDNEKIAVLEYFLTKQQPTSTATPPAQVASYEAILNATPLQEWLDNPKDIDPQACKDVENDELKKMLLAQINSKAAIMKLNTAAPAAAKPSFFSKGVSGASQQPAFNSSPPEKDYTRFLKVCVVGNAGSGKTSLIDKFVKDTFSQTYKPTGGVDVSNKSLKIKDEKVNLSLYDVPSNPNLKSVNARAYQGAHAYLLVCDLTNKKSLDDLQEWLKEIKPYLSHDTKLFLVATKFDLMQERQFSPDDLISFSERHRLEVIGETSAKEAANLERPFMAVARSTLTMVDKRVSDQAAAESKPAVPSGTTPRR